MITLICTNCKATLEMDDAFAGGVCRCQHCGTIQTVPSRTKRSASPEFGYAAPPAVQKEARSLYQREEAAPAPPTMAGLDDLAEAVASSGLSRKTLAAKSAAPPTPAAPVDAADATGDIEKKPVNKKLFLIIGAAVAGLLLIGVVLFLVLHGKGKNNDETGSESVEEDEAAFKGPNFVGVQLDDPSVVYILDRGNAAQDFFDPLKASVYRSLELIGQDKKFAVILTDNGEQGVAYPKDGLAPATPDQFDSLRQVTQDVVATGNSHLRSALESAVARKPAVIVIATAKGELDDDDIAALKDAATKGIKIDSFALGQTPGSQALRDASSASGGTFKQMSDDHTMRKFANTGR